MFSSRKDLIRWRLGQRASSDQVHYRPVIPNSFASESRLMVQSILTTRNEERGRFIEPIGRIVGAPVCFPSSADRRAGICDSGMPRSTVGVYDSDLKLDRDALISARRDASAIGEAIRGSGRPREWSFPAAAPPLRPR